jgi:outer membrane protein assembly factor BamD (BamD/ComL family)
MSFWDRWRSRKNQDPRAKNQQLKTHTRCHDLAWMLAATFAVALAGCASMGQRAPTVGEPLASQPSSPDDVGEEAGPLSWSDFSLDNLGKTTKKLTGRGPNRQIARQLYEAADAEYRRAADAQGPERMRLFSAAGPKFAEAAERWPDSALAMDALFMAGESEFFADNYPAANKNYEKLIKAFPNNKYMDVVDQRRFAIAKYWLDLHHDSPEAFYYVNLLDSTRPWKDARGNGLRVYDKIRVDDPTGRFSDDATLAAANEHFAAGRYYRADEYYSDLRKAYPASEHQFLAHFLGLKAKLYNYGGPSYSGAPLDEAEQLIKQMRRTFPQECEREREYIDRAAAQIRLLKAQRLEHLARYYDRRGEFRAESHYLTRIVNEYPDTPLAQVAQERMGQIAGLPPVPPQRAQWLVNLFPEADPVKPLLEATEEMRLAEAQRSAEERNDEIQEDLDAGKEPSLVGGMMGNFFDR